MNDLAQRPISLDDPKTLSELCVGHAQALQSVIQKVSDAASGEESMNYMDAIVALLRGIAETQVVLLFNVASLQRGRMAASRIEVPRLIQPGRG